MIPVRLFVAAVATFPRMAVPDDATTIRHPVEIASLLGGASESEQRALERGLDALLGRQGLRASFSRLVTFDPSAVLAPFSATEAAVARAWLRRDGDIVHIYLVPRGADRFFFRQLALASGLDEIGREGLAQVVDASLAAVLENPEGGLSRAEAERRLGVTPPPAPPLRPPPPVPAPAVKASEPEPPIVPPRMTSGVAVVCGVGHGPFGRNLATGDTAQASLLALGVRRPAPHMGSESVGFWADVNLDWPMDVSDGRFRARRRSGALFTGASFRIIELGRFSLELDAGVGVRLTAVGAESSLRLGGRGAVVTGVRVARRFTLALLLASELFYVRDSYQYITSDGRTELFADGWPVRPMALLAVMTHFPR